MSMGVPLLNADNEVTAGVVIFRDTTTDKQAATALEQKVKELHDQTINGWKIARRLS